MAVTQNPLETVDVHDLLYMSRGHSCQISVFCDLQMKYTLASFSEKILGVSAFGIAGSGLIENEW